MKKMIMDKLYNFIVLVSILSVNIAYGMISKFQYKPWVPAHNNELSKKRSNELLISIDPDIATRKVTEQEKPWRCFGYAMHKISGSTTPLHLEDICDENDVILYRAASIDIEKVFDQIRGPEEGALAVYTDDAHRIQHYAVVIDYVTFESKWGTQQEIRQHKPFDVPDYYQDAISFWKLKKEFITPEGKKNLLRIIKKDAEAFEKERWWLLLLGCSVTEKIKRVAIVALGGWLIINWLKK